MAQKTIKISKNTAKQLKQRRNELNLTIEEAASKAGVGTKTWSRYESGESIRADKCKGVCRALKWRTFPSEDADHGCETIESIITECKNHNAWSQSLADGFGDMAAMSIAIGSDLLLDKVQQDLNELSSLPQNTHIGQLSYSFLCDSLPPQFLMRYDYDFLFLFRSVLLRLIERYKNNGSIYAHSVLEEIILYNCVEEAESYIEIIAIDADNNSNWSEWIFDLFDDCDIETFLYSNSYVSEENIYHFKYWNDQQFYTC